MKKKSASFELLPYGPNVHLPSKVDDGLSKMQTVESGPASTVMLLPVDTTLEPLVVLELLLDTVVACELAVVERPEELAVVDTDPDDTVEPESGIELAGLEHAISHAPAMDAAPTIRTTAGEANMSRLVFTWSSPLCPR